MTADEVAADRIDWSLTTWDGSRREQLRRWAALPLERIILAIEEMEQLGAAFGGSPGHGTAARERVKGASQRRLSACIGG